MVSCGFGHWLRGEAAVPGTPPRLISGGAPSGVPVSKIAASAAAWDDETTLVMTWRYYETPHSDQVTCKFEGDRVTISFLSSLTAMNPKAKDARAEVVGTADVKPNHRVTSGVIGAMGRGGRFGSVFPSMQRFTCDCGNVLFFGSFKCLKCGGGGGLQSPLWDDGEGASRWAHEAMCQWREAWRLQLATPYGLKVGALPCLSNESDHS